MAASTIHRFVAATAVALLFVARTGVSQSVDATPAAGPDGTAAASAPLPHAASPSTWSIAAGFDPDTLEKLAARATAAVVLIDVRTPGGGRQGSGFLVTPDGRIVTNYHVIRDAESARVKLASGDVYDQVTILGADERRDIAVVQVSGFDLPVLRLGNSDSVRIGAPVVAIGSPLGLENTVSTGIISGRRQEPEGYQLLQISAPASSGSSGGPVLSRSGDVVGIAVSQKRGGQNLNFAVPINYARGLLGHLGSEPVAVLSATSRADTSEQEMARPDPAPKAVNRDFDFDMSGFDGYSVQMTGTEGDASVRTSRITVRLIETVGTGEPLIERYVEGTTTEPSGSFGTPRIVRRVRSRTIATADGLRPISARGEVAWWTDQGWSQSEYDLRFDGYLVRGLIRDSTGRVLEVDRQLPDGIVLRELRDVAFGVLASDSLIGRSIELMTFDAATGTETTDRYDIEEGVSVELAGQSWDALRVNLASDLSNTEALFRRDEPRLPLRFRRPDDWGSFLVMEAAEVDLFSRAAPDTDPTSD